MGEHASLLTLEGTGSRDYPLILFVGQEPNTTGSSGAYAGHYPKAAITAGSSESEPFWSKANGIVGNTMGQPAA